MTEKAGFNWKYLIPGYGCYVIRKAETKGKGKLYALNIFITLVVLGIIGSGSDDMSTATPEQEPVETAMVEKIHKVGEPVKTEKFEIIITTVNTRKSVGGDFLSEKATEGALFAVVNFSYKNATKEPISSYSVPEIKIVDPNGTGYDKAAGATIAYHSQANINTKSLSDINPGITQKDAAVFEVSSELWNKKGWKLSIDADEDYEVTIK